MIYNWLAFFFLYSIKEYEVISVRFLCIFFFSRFYKSMEIYQRNKLFLTESNADYHPVTLMAYGHITLKPGSRTMAEVKQRQVLFLSSSISLSPLFSRTRNVSSSVSFHFFLFAPFNYFPLPSFSLHFLVRVPFLNSCISLSPKWVNA